MSKAGSLILGVVGAGVGTFFGNPALGWTLGSALGSALFPTSMESQTISQEGPRLSDTKVTASTVGVPIAQHWGVTRTSGNIIWSGGLREEKVVKKTKTGGGGGKGGGGGDGGSTVKQTYYYYYCSFALALGRGEAQQIRRIWADGKLIYNASSSKKNKIDGLSFSVHSNMGEGGTFIDPLIQRSINARLAGKDDVNKGNQPQKSYTTFNELYAQATSDTTPRGALYRAKMAERKAEADALLEAGETPDYRMTPAYKDLVYLVFDDLPLKDFGNRIPNLTIEVAWAGAKQGLMDSEDEIADLIDSLPEFSVLPVEELAPRGWPNDPHGLASVSHKGGYMVLKHEDYYRVFDQAYGGEVAIKKFDGTTKLVKTFGVSSERVGLVWLTSTNSSYQKIDDDEPRQMVTTTSNYLAILHNATSEVKETYSDFSPGIIKGAVCADLGLTQYEIDVVSDDDIDNAGRGRAVWLIATLDGVKILSHSARIQGFVHDEVYDDVLAGGQSVPYMSMPFFVKSLGDCSARVAAVRYGTNALSIRAYDITDEWYASNAPYEGWTRPDPAQLLIDPHDPIDVIAPFNQTMQRINFVVWHQALMAYIVFADLADGTSGAVAIKRSNGNILWTTYMPFALPTQSSGMSNSIAETEVFCFAPGKTGTQMVKYNLTTGSYIVEEGIYTDRARDFQIWMGDLSALLIWDGGVPYYGATKESSLHYAASLLEDLAAQTTSVITDLLDYAGYDSSEIDLSEVPKRSGVRGYTCANQMSVRAALQPILTRHSLEAVESDYKIKVRPRGSDVVRVIPQEDLGTISDDGGDVDYVELRKNEADLPIEVNIAFADIDTDYQSGIATAKRISAPNASVQSTKVLTTEYAMSMRQYEADEVVVTALYDAWMTRTTSSFKLGWRHADLDPTDMVQVNLGDGRILQERVSAVQMGADFTLEIGAERGGDPVYTPPQAPRLVAALPTPGDNTVRPSYMFPLDIPLLRDYHSTARASLLHYYAVGATHADWEYASVYRATDTTNGYGALETVEAQATWGYVLGDVPAPRTLWTTDTETVIDIALEGDFDTMESITYKRMLDGENMAALMDIETGEAEIIQFQTVEFVDEGTVRISTLLRGCRGTDRVAMRENSGALVFILLEESSVHTKTDSLELVDESLNWKAVSAYQLIDDATNVVSRVKGNSLRPYAPSRVTRVNEDDGGITVTWNRRTRIGGQWNLTTGVETVPISEDSEIYEIYLIADLESFDPDNGVFLQKTVVGGPSRTYSAALLASHGLTNTDPIYVAIAQVSGQVGRGFVSKGRLAP